MSIAGAGAACGSSDEESPPTRACGIRIWHKPASADTRVEVVGDWDGWKRPGTTPDLRDDGWRVAAFDVPAGEHAYAIVEDGVWLTDKNVPMTGFHDEHEVSVAVAADCDRPALKVESVEAKPNGEATVKVSFAAARTKHKLDAGSLVGSERRAGPALRVVTSDPRAGTATLAATGLARGKYTYRLSAKDEGGVEAESARAVVWIDAASGKEAWDPRDALVYQIFVDRYRTATGALAPPKTPSDRAGGTLAGVRAAIESGEIEALGVNTLWLSPLYANPRGDFAGNDGRQYTSYHGYWPIAARGLDDRVTTQEELDSFMHAAHARGIRVLFDVVPNHVHSEHPWAKEHADWFKPGCVCGQPKCDWATNIKTCWFAPYLPDLDWKNPEAARAMTADVMWWFDRQDADGIRIDAVPMMPRSATRRIASEVRTQYEHPGHTPYVIGENFTGPGGYQSLRYDLGPFGLDGSFHFPLMWTLREVVALEHAPMSEIDASFRAGEQAWDGSGAVMGLMIDNHDVSRFASVSAGNADGDTWMSPPQPVDPSVYAKQRLALATVLTLPGAPVLYYGDEVGLAGRSDPDCRRVMPAEAALSDAQQATRALARKVGSARTCSRALRRGAVRPLLADAERFAFAREVDGEIAIVALTRRPTAAVDAPLPPNAPVALVDVTSGKRVDATARALRVEPDAFGVHVYVAAEGGCAR